jgi:hypothetical protein
LWTGVGSELSEEQLMQKTAKTSKSIDFAMVTNVGFKYDQKFQKYFNGNVFFYFLWIFKV